jgi:hypothetical protein
MTIVLFDAREPNVPPAEFVLSRVKIGREQSMAPIEMRTCEDAIVAARACVEENYGCKPNSIPWKVGTVDPYESADYRAEIHLINGTPPKGFVVVVRYNFGQNGKVIAFDLNMNRLDSWNFNTAHGQ